jgi:hypothetical protein
VRRSLDIHDREKVTLTADREDARFISRIVMQPEDLGVIPTCHEPRTLDDKGRDYLTDALRGLIAEAGLFACVRSRCVESAVTTRSVETAGIGRRGAWL